MSEALPQLLDTRALREELGISRAAAETLMQHLPLVTFDGLRKVFVRRDDVRAYIEASTKETDRRVHNQKETS